MAKFLYSMQNVLDIKERLETQAKTEYAEMLPFLLMTLHFSQIGLTDDLTFTAKASFQTSSFAIIAQPFLSTQGKFYKIYKEYFVHIFLLFLFISPNDSSFC